MAAKLYRVQYYDDDSGSGWVTKWFDTKRAAQQEAREAFGDGFDATITAIDKPTSQRDWYWLFKKYAD